MKTKNNKKWSIDSFINKSNFDYCGKFKYTALVSGVIIIVGLILLLVNGFNLGIDFTGGYIVQFEIGSELSETNSYNSYVDAVNDILKEYNTSVGSDQKSGDGASAILEIRYYLSGDMTDEELNEINNDIYAAFEESFPNIEITNSESIGATASSQLIIDTMTAIIIAVLFILIYIAIRFEMANGLSSIFALVHDVLILLSLVLLFNIEINSSFVAAIITVIGYSINNTIVVFDRIRDNSKKDNYLNANVIQLANDSIRQTLTRSIYTALTTMISVLLLCIIGVDSLQQFILPIFFGLLAGTYSSIFLAAPLWAMMSRGNIGMKKKIK